MAQTYTTEGADISRAGPARGNGKALSLSLAPYLVCLSAVALFRLSDARQQDLFVLKRLPKPAHHLSAPYHSSSAIGELRRFDSLGIRVAKCPAASYVFHHHHLHKHLGRG